MSGSNHSGKHEHHDPGGTVWVTLKESLRISVGSETIRVKLKRRNTEVKYLSVEADPVRLTNGKSKVLSCK